jgi:phytoene dehydrogenase-like protein
MERTNLRTESSSRRPVVIGAGVAGLFAAHFLARGGRPPLVLEHNHQAGGCLNGFARKGFRFDAGDQSFEQLGIVFPLLRDLDLIDRFRFHRTHYRLVAPGMDAVIDSFQRLEQAFLGAFPGDAPGVASLFRALREGDRVLAPVLGEGAPLQRRGLSRAAALVRAAIHVARHARMLRRMMNTGARDFAGAHLADPVLRNFVSRIGYKNMSWAVFAGFLRCWVHDYWYPAGGLQAFCDGLVEALRERGGEVRFKETVARILVQGGRVTGVETERGERIAADAVIACGDMKALYRDLLPEDAAPAGRREEFQSAAPSEALTSVYLGVDLSPEQLAPILRTHHVFFFPDFDVHDPDRADDPHLHRGAWLEVSCPSLTDPSLAPPGRSVLVLQTMAPAAWLERWGRALDPTKRTYRDLKRRVTDEMVATAEALIPDLSGKILTSDVGTPLSAERFTLNTGGATAGWTFDPDRSVLRDRYTAITTPVRGLLAAGHYALWPGGVPSAALSGRIAALLALHPRLGRAAAALERGVARLSASR